MTDSRELSVQPRASENLLAQVIAAAKDPQIDAAKMETLARLVNSQQDREREIEFNRAKNAAIMEMPVITKDGRIVIRKQGEQPREQGRFARFEDIDRVCRPILQRHNLAISFEMNERQGGGITVTPILSHANGMNERGGGFPVPPETSGSKNAAQAMGSSAKYGQRYSYCAMLNIVTEGVDDDGNGGRGTTVHLPFEREQTVLTEAAAAAEAGTYRDWFNHQSPKDRAYIIQSGKHGEYGGQTSLPKPKPEPEPIVINQDEDNRPATDQEQRDHNGGYTIEEERRQEQHEPEPTAEKKPQRTPRQWVDGFKEHVGQLTTLKDLDDFEDRMREPMGKLKSADNALWKEADDHALERREMIENGRLV